MTKLDYQVAVVGGGPAGSAATLSLLKQGYDVVLIESSNYEQARVGETLAPSAQPLLKYLGLWSEFTQLEFKPSFSTISAWGSPALLSNDSIFSPYGTGWHLDRPLFDSFLAETAGNTGATLLKCQQVSKCIKQADGTWSLSLYAAGQLRKTITVQAVIQATGRKARLSRRIGVSRQVYDHLVGIAVQYEGVQIGGSYALVESVQNGWWYSAPIPPNKMIVMLMTDADLCHKYQLSNTVRWRQHLSQTHYIKARIAKLKPIQNPGVHSAISHRLQGFLGDAPWLACGDAAMSVDPLSGSGILNAIRTGIVAGEAMAEWLKGNSQLAQNYTQWLGAEFAKYWKQRNAHYALENRWSDAPFWQRRFSNLEPMSTR